MLVLFPPLEPSNEGHAPRPGCALSLLQSTRHSRTGSATQAGSGRQGCASTLQQYGLGRQAAQALLVKHETCK